MTEPDEGSPEVGAEHSQADLDRLFGDIGPGPARRPASSVAGDLDRIFGDPGPTDHAGAPEGSVPTGSVAALFDPPTTEDAPPAAPRPPGPPGAAESGPSRAEGPAEPAGDAPVETAEVEGDAPVETTAAEADAPVETVAAEADAAVETAEVEGDASVETAAVEGDASVETAEVEGDALADQPDAGADRPAAATDGSGPTDGGDATATDDGPSRAGSPTEAADPPTPTAPGATRPPAAGEPSDPDEDARIVAAAVASSAARHRRGSSSTPDADRAAPGRGTSGADVADRVGPAPRPSSGDGAAPVGADGGRAARGPSSGDGAAPTGASSGGDGGDRGGAARKGGPGRPRDDQPAATPLEQLRRTTPARSRWWSIGFPVVIALVVLAIPALVWFGKESILDSTDGNVVDVVDDPRAPGYEALTEPTPTMLVLQEDSAGELGSATVLTLTGPTSAGLVSIPPDTVVMTPTGAPVALTQAYAEGGADDVATLVGSTLNAAMGEVRVVSDAEWADLLDPVGPLEIDNADDVVGVGADGAESIEFPAGTLALEPDDVGRYLASTSPGESDLNRMVRQQRVWAAWFQAVAAAGDDPAVVPGEVDTGLGRFVRGMADAQVELQTLPVQRVPLPGTDQSVFTPLTDQIPPLVARLIPFPQGAPPGARLTVRVLDGTGRLQQGLPAANAIVLGGGEITTVGNAASFDRATTELVYHDEARRPEVEALRDELGVGELVPATDVLDAVDVTIILGADAEAVLEPTTVVTSSLPPTTVAPGGG